MTVKTALIVDDSRAACAVLSRMLLRLNVQSHAVNSAKEGFEYLKDHRPDVIFMDHAMPDMDGTEAVKVIKANQHWQSIPILMFTAKTGDDYLQEVKALGVYDVVNKALNLSMLANTLTKLELIKVSQANKEQDEPSMEQKLQIWLESLIENKIAPALSFRIDSATREMREETLQNSQQLYQKSLRFHMNQQDKITKQMEAEREFLAASYSNSQLSLFRKLIILLGSIVSVMLVLFIVQWFSFQSSKSELLSEISELKGRLTSQSNVKQLSSRELNGTSETRNDEALVFNSDGEPVATVLDYVNGGETILAKSYKNYFFQMNRNGVIQSFDGERYFSAQDCYGDVWVEAQSGVVFTANDTSLWYTPVDAKPQYVTVFSKQDKNGQCESLTTEKELVQLLPNEVALTGLESRFVKWR